MKRIVMAAMLLVMYGALLVFAQQPTKQAHAESIATLSDKAKLEIRDEQLALTQIQMQLNALAQQYQDEMKKDERYKKIEAASNEHSSKLQSLIDASKKELKVPDGMEFDFGSLSWVKPQPSPTPKPN